MGFRASSAAQSAATRPTAACSCSSTGGGIGSRHCDGTATAMCSRKIGCSSAASMRALGPRTSCHSSAVPSTMASMSSPTSTRLTDSWPARRTATRREALNRAIEPLPLRGAHGSGARSRLKIVATVMHVHEFAPDRSAAPGRAKPSRPSSACEPSVRDKPAPAGRLLRAGCHHRGKGHRSGNSSPSRGVGRVPALPPRSLCCQGRQSRADASPGRSGDN